MTNKTKNNEFIDKIINNPSIASNPFYAEVIKGMYQGKPLFGKDGLLTPLIKEFTQIALQGEMDAHLAEQSFEEGPNRRNGVSTKTVKTASGSFELDTPRDRNGNFEPQLIKKRQTILTEELDNKILALYSLGTGYDGISEHLSDMYGVDVSAATISAVTDKLVPMIAQWRSRP